MRPVRHRIVVFLAIVTSVRAVHAQQKSPLAVGPVDAKLAWTPPRVVVTLSEVTLGKRRVADTPQLAAAERTERIEPLIHELTARARERRDSDSSVPRSAVLEVSDSISFRVVRKLLFSVAQAGYGPVSFADSDLPIQPPLDCDRDEKRPVVLLLHTDGYVLYGDGSTPTALVNDGERYDDRALATALSKHRATGHNDLKLAPDDDASFGHVAAAMKLVKAAGFSCLALTYGAGGSARTPVPLIRSARSDGRGSLSKSVIQSTIHAHDSEVRACYQRFLERTERQPEAVRTALKTEGKVTVKFVIDATGTVATAALSATELHDSALEACVVESVRKLVFPAPEGGGIVVANYPFAFATGD